MGELEDFDDIEANAANFADELIRGVDSFKSGELSKRRSARLSSKIMSNNVSRNAY